MFCDCVILQKNVILACAYKNIDISKIEVNVYMFIRYFHIWRMKFTM